ncbi:MAG: hypothetical protein J0M24_12495 [Verrucomicrobia bacterium]|nr:hypothetical protein [Verrucomicrobiota bacterium]
MQTSKRTLTNHFQDVELWNINPDATIEDRGPFLVVQIGVAPGDDRQEEKLFALRPDGNWADLMYYFSLGKPDALDPVVFESSQAVMQLLDQLGSKAKVDPVTVSAEQLRAWLDRTQGGNLKERLRSWLQQYRNRHDPNAAA